MYFRDLEERPNTNNASELEMWRLDKFLTNCRLRKKSPSITELDSYSLQDIYEIMDNEEQDVFRLSII